MEILQPAKVETTYRHKQTERLLRKEKIGSQRLQARGHGSRRKCLSCLALILFGKTK